MNQNTNNKALIIVKNDSILKEKYFAIYFSQLNYVIF